MTLIVMICGFVLLVFFVWILLPYIYRKYEIYKLENICITTRTLVLTYDDGPSSGLTTQLLELLAEYEAPATFFVLGQMAEKTPTLISRIGRGNHEIGNHSFSHINAWMGLPWNVARDIRKGDAELLKHGCDITFFRPPNGKITFATLVQALFEKRRFAWWTIDSTDTHTRTIDVDDLTKIVSRKGGGVILLHDFERVNDPSRNKFVMDATRSLLELAKREKFTVRKFGDLLDITD